MELPEPAIVRELPLFPLGTVLFPGALLPLHVFEQRYRTMIEQCLAGEQPEFGVMLIREGDEVVERPPGAGPEGTPATPHQVGTVARIVGSRHLPDGRYFLVCQGQARIRLRRLVQQRPFLVGEVETLPDEPVGAGSPAAQLATQVREATNRLLAAVEQALPDSRADERRQVRELAHTIPDAPSALSYFVPRTLSTATSAERQRLLECNSVEERLRLALTLLRRDEQVLRQMRAAGSGPAASSLN